MSLTILVIYRITRDLSQMERGAHPLSFSARCVLHNIREPRDSEMRYTATRLNCGRDSMVEFQLPKLTTRVRFPSPAPADLTERLGINRLGVLFVGGVRLILPEAGRNSTKQHEGCGENPLRPSPAKPACHHALNANGAPSNRRKAGSPKRDDTGSGEQEREPQDPGPRARGKEEKHEDQRT